MKWLLIVLIMLALSVPSFAAISVKGGLAGGAFRLGATLDRPLTNNLNLLGDLGYGFGNGYSLLTAAAGVQAKIRDNIYIGADVCYSSYSSAVRLGLPAVDITDLSGVGLGIFAGLTRDKLYGQIGYDTRLGAIAEAGYVVRM